MVNRNSMIAFGLTAASTFYMCGDSPPDIVPVQEEVWVEVTENATQHFRKPLQVYWKDDDGPESTRYMHSGEICRIETDGELVITASGIVKYRKGSALGTECPDGVGINMTPDRAKRQGWVKPAMFRVGETDLVEIAGPKAKPVLPGGDVDNRDVLIPGDECVVSYGSYLVIVNAGLVVYRDIDASGTECPDGTILAMTSTEAKGQHKSYISSIQRD